jgi:hypothetical protein
VLRRSEVGLRLRNVVVRVRGKKQSCQGANGRDYCTGVRVAQGAICSRPPPPLPGRQGKARQLNCNPGPPAKDDLPELAPEDCGHAPGEHSQLHVES